MENLKLSELKAKSPAELLTFADPNLALFDVYVQWTADHPADQLKSTLFATGVFCP